MNTQSPPDGPIVVLANIEPARDRFIIEKAASAHRALWKRGTDVSSQTRRSQAVCREWQQSVEGSEDGFKTEHPFPSGTGKQCIDVFDAETQTAYELKTSPNNVHHEFYKDVFKVLAFNEMSGKKGPIKRFYFLAPGRGLASLDGDLLCETIAVCARLKVEVIPVDLRTSTLHDAMVQVLKSTRLPELSVKEIAARVNRKRLYVRENGDPVDSAQIQSRSSHHRDLFTQPDGDPSRLCLKW